MDNTPSEGQVLGFRTSPYSEFAPKHANRFGAVKVLGVNSDTVVMAVLGGTFEAIPTLEQAASSEILRMNRLAHKDVEAVVVFAKNWWSEMELTELTRLGHLRVSSEEYNRAQSHFSPKKIAAPPNVIFAVSWTSARCESKVRVGVQSHCSPPDFWSPETCHLLLANHPE